MSTMQPNGVCAQCGMQNPYAARNCAGCGARLPWAAALEAAEQRGLQQAPGSRALEALAAVRVQLATIQEEQARYRRVLDLVHGALYRRDPVGSQLTMLSAGLQDILGYAAPELTAEVWASLVQETLMRGPATGLSLDEALARSRAGQLPHWSADYRIRNRAGEERWIADDSILIPDAAGRTVETLGLLQDITERKHMAERFEQQSRALGAVVAITDELLGCASSDALLRSIVELARTRLGLDRTGLFLFDETGQTLLGSYGTDLQGQTTAEHEHRLTMNEALRQVLGSVMEERTDWSLTEPVQFQAWDGDRFVTTGRTGWRVATSVRSSQGLVGIFLYDNARSGLPFNRAHQEVVLVFASLAGNLIENKRAQEQLQAFTHQLSRSNRELQEFAYVASHDLQEPLRKIQAFADIIEHRHGPELSPEARDYLGRMQRAGSRMSRLLTDLLALSRITTRVRPFEPIDLTTILEEVISDLELTIQEQHAHIDSAPLPQVAADPVQMRQLFQNLVANAIKFHQPNQEPVIRIWAQTPEPGEHCQVFVQDNGIGFEEKYLEKIFLPFQRLHGREEYDGTGMGLAICRRIVERHHGAITATSQPGVGTTFTVTLPLKS